MTQGFRVAIPGKDANTAIPKEVITDTSLLSLPIYWEGPVVLTCPGGTSTVLTATGSVAHDLGYRPLTFAFSTNLVSDGTNVIENTAGKVTYPTIQLGWIYEVMSFTDSVTLRVTTGEIAVTNTPFQLHGYLFIYDFKIEGLPNV